jgi:hypothetical protein
MALSAARKVMWHTHYITTPVLGNNGQGDECLLYRNVSS